MKKNSHNRRCNKCRYDESPTAGTTFEKLKFSISIDFHIVFKICTKKKRISSIKLSNEFELRQMTCWVFKKKTTVSNEKQSKKHIKRSYSR